MAPFRFCVLGDTHYCTLAERAVVRHRGIAPDALRYAGFTQEVLPPLATLIRDQNPDLLISTGDMIEGMRPNTDAGNAANLADETSALSLLRPCAPRFLRARGTHDRRHPEREWQTVTLPGGYTFIILDYTHWDDTQRHWLRQQLDETDDAPRRFVVAHPPLHLFGRHFFDSVPFRADVTDLLRGHPVDAYFCGHTHNQTASFHDGLLHLTGSSIGYPVPLPPALDEWHAIPDALRDSYLWGIPEDFDPAFLLIDLDGDALHLTRMTLHGPAGRLVQRRRFAPPELLDAPPVERLAHPLRPTDQLQIRAARLNLFAASGADEATSRLTLNGHPLGPIPHGVCYEARHFVQLPQELLRDLSSSNVLDITFPDRAPFAYGSFTLTLELLDGRRLMSRVTRERFVCGDRADFSYGRREAIPVAPGQTVSVRLDFA